MLVLVITWKHIFTLGINSQPNSQGCNCFTGLPTWRPERGFHHHIRSLPSSQSSVTVICAIYNEIRLQGLREKDLQIKDVRDSDRGKQNANIYYWVITETTKNVRRRLLTFPCEDLMWMNADTIQKRKSACPAYSPSKALSLLHTKLQTNSVK